LTGRAAFVFLFGRRQQASRWIFVGAAVLLFIVALAGHRHGAVAWYAVLGTLCLLQVLYPTFAGWCVVFVLFLYAALQYSILVVGDVVRLWAGSDPPQVFSDPVNTVVTLLQFSMVIFIAIRLPFVRPRLPPAQDGA